MLNHESTRKKNTKSVSSTADSIFRVQVAKEQRAASKNTARLCGQPTKFRTQLTILKVNLNDYVFPQSCLSVQVHSKICPKFTFLSRTSADFYDTLDLCTKLRPRSVEHFKTPGALILGFSRMWSTVQSI